MRKSTLFVGLDDSKASIQVAIAEGVPGGEVREYGAIPNTPEALTKLVRRLGRSRDLYFAYEAGPCGYAMYRTLLGLGASCMSKTPPSASHVWTSRSESWCPLGRCGLSSPL